MLESSRCCRNYNFCDELDLFNNDRFFFQKCCFRVFFEKVFLKQRKNVIGEVFEPDLKNGTEAKIVLLKLTAM